MQSEVLAHQEEQSVPEELHEGRSEEVVKNESGISESVESACSGNCANRKVKTEEADGSSRRQEGSTSLSLFLEACGLEVEYELPVMATQTWTDGAWIGKWDTEPREAWMKETFEVQT